MIEKLMNGDFFARIFSIIGQIIGNFAVELDFAFFDQLQNKRGGKLLGDGSDAEFRVRLVRNLSIPYSPFRNLFCK